MSDIERIQLIGSPGSPYTRKMVALMRYRQIPYSIIWGRPREILPKMGIDIPKPVLLPTFLLRDDNGDMKAVTDSTPIIRRLESMSTERSVLPRDPVLAFIDYLLEDFGDEWATKYMFHYRWHSKTDADNAGTLLPLIYDLSMTPEQLEEARASFTDLQVGRLHVVGSNDITAPVIDASYRRFLQAMEAHLERQPYLLGSRPGAGDFALYGQLSQLVGLDPTSREIAHQISPRTVSWVTLMEDLSGLPSRDDDWNKPDEIPDTLRGLLQEVGKMYAPVQLANAKAVQAGQKTWQAEIDGSLWAQQTFLYQAKCLKWLNEQYQALSEEDRGRVISILEGTGCETMLFDAEAK